MRRVLAATTLALAAVSVGVTPAVAAVTPSAVAASDGTDPSAYAPGTTTTPTTGQDAVVPGVETPHSPGGVGDGPVGRPFLLSSSAAIFAQNNPGARPQGVNDFTCRPAPGTRPVVIVPGTGADAFTVGSSLGPRLKAAGLCVYSFSYNPSTNPVSPQASQSGDIRATAQFMSGFVDRVLESTGADKVDLVGHSQGAGPLPRAYIKWYGGWTKVDKLVGMSPSNHGTTFGGLATLVNRDGSLSRTILDQLARDHNQLALSQQLVGSGFNKALDADGLTVPGISYTVIATKYDMSVTPYTTAFINEPGVTNITLQDVCPWHLTDHANMPYDKAVQQMVVNALLPEQAKPVSCG